MRVRRDVLAAGRFMVLASVAGAGTAPGGCRPRTHRIRKVNLNRG
jgi:hypothetical protein